MNCTTVNGNTTCEQAGHYGTLGTPAEGNVPGSRAGAAGWIDGNGILWLFGGGVENADGTSFSYLNLSTDNQLAGYTYTYTILLNDGSAITFMYGLK